MGIMVKFCCPYSEEEPDVVLGPFQEVEINDQTVFADGVHLGHCSSGDDVVWVRDGKFYDSVKIFAASSVVPA